MEKTYDTQKAIEAQKRYAEEKGYPHFAPSSGRCWNCGMNIYQHYKIGDRVSQGISVESASSSLVTGCPHCHRSYCD